MTTLPGEAVDLYGLEPGSFVAARNALVKELKRGKRTEEAAAVAALRRPSVADGAVNAAVRAAPQLATVWAAAVVALADEQSAAIGGAGGHLREATVALREATGPLVDAAVAAIGNEAKRGEIIGALRAASTRPGAAMVAAGILGAADPTDDLFAGAPDPPARAASAPDPAAVDGASDAEAVDSRPARDPADEPAVEAEQSERHAAQPTRQQRTAERVAARQAERAAAAAAAAERLAAAEEAASSADAALAAARAAEAEARDALRVAAAAVSEAEAAARRVKSELVVARRGAGARS